MSTSLPVEPADTPSVLWNPPTDPLQTRMGEFMAFCERRVGRSFSDYDELWEWSVGEGLEQCWGAVWDFFHVEAATPYERVLNSTAMPGAKWFEGATLNYATHVLRNAADDPDAEAVIGVSQSRDRTAMTWRELAEQVARVRCWLVEQGVGVGDRVAAYLPHVPETVVAFLATASLGAVWTSCAPEFGVRAVLDRLSQVEPTVLFAVEAYRYGHRHVDRRRELGEIVAGLPSLNALVVVDYVAEQSSGGDGSIDSNGPTVDAVGWDRVLNARAEPFEPVAVRPDHPLYVLYSSGTTGLPKPILHGHGGVLLEHFKVLGLHCDLGPQDRLFWFTTTGWVMWNFVVSALLVGASVVAFDGDPSGDGPDTLWRLAAEESVTFFGVGAPFLTAASRAGESPRERFDLAKLRGVGSTGAPLPPEGFDWVYRHVSERVLLSPISGGTDVCSAFVGGSPLTPVWRGEIPCRYLGCAAEAFDEAGHPVVGSEGELVITKPMPSMPVGFWGDDDGSRYRAAYFDYFPGVWRHGDWVTFTERGSCVISGRSDATLNRGGVRVGTAEIYRVVEAVDGVNESLVVHLEAPAGDGPGELVLFVTLDDGLRLDDELIAGLRSVLRNEISPRHVPDVVYEIAAVPTTLSGKKLELPVKKILRGAAPADVASAGALKDPAALDAIVAIAADR